jgi:hypothetical protein
MGHSRPITSEGGSPAELCRPGRLRLIVVHPMVRPIFPHFAGPAGLPLVQDALPSLFTHARAGKLTPEQLVHKTSHAVATATTSRSAATSAKATGPTSCSWTPTPPSPASATKSWLVALRRPRARRDHRRHLRQRRTGLRQLASVDVVRGRRLEFGPTR